MPLTKKQNHWSVLRYLIYFTQVGVSVVTPPILCCFAALWLKRRFALGNGTVIIGIVLGIAVAEQNGSCRAPSDHGKKKDRVRRAREQADACQNGI